MSSNGVFVEKDTIELEEELALEDGTTYVLQNKGDHRLFLILADDGAHLVPTSEFADRVEQFVESGRGFIHTPEDGKTLFAYYKSGDGANVSVVNIC